MSHPSSGSAEGSAHGGRLPERDLASQGEPAVFWWPLTVAPGARAGALLLWFVAAGAVVADVIQSILAGQVLRTMLSVALGFALVPAWQWLHERRRRVRLSFAVDTGWSADRLGPIRPPTVLVDVGSWMLLLLQPLDPTSVRSTLVLPVMTASPDAQAWTRLRQALRAMRPHGEPA